MDSRQSKPPVQATLHSRRLKMSDGVTLAATVSGQRGQPAVILLHGGGQTRHSWQGTVQTLGALGYHALAFDARGHGDSDWSAKPDYSYDRLADDLETVASKMADAPVIIGASMGGMTAMHAIGRNPTKLAWAMVLVDSAPRSSIKGLKRTSAFLNG